MCAACTADVKWRESLMFRNMIRLRLNIEYIIFLNIGTLTVTQSNVGTSLKSSIIPGIKSGSG